MSGWRAEPGYNQNGHDAAAEISTPRAGSCPPRACKAAAGRIEAWASCETLFYFDVDNKFFAIRNSLQVRFLGSLKYLKFFIYH
jgi:hypothetical protein